MDTRYFVYILLCQDKTLYTGFTTDPYSRKSRHNAGKGARYTRSRRPVYFCYLEELESQSAALRREREIKNLNRREKLNLVEKQKTTTLQLLLSLKPEKHFQNLKKKEKKAKKRKQTTETAS